MPPKGTDVFRLIHSADWHLGKTLADLDRTLEHEAFLKWLVEIIVHTKTDALLVSGDVFDSATPPQSASRLYFEFLAALNQRTDCKVIITGGNHDSPSHLAAPSTLLKAVNTHVVPALQQEESVTVIPLSNTPAAGEAPNLVVAAIPYLRERDLRVGRMGQTMGEIQSELREGIKARYAEAASVTQAWLEKGCTVIATGHLTVVGGSTTSSEREIHIGGLGAVGSDVFPAQFAYVALGHLHRPQAIGAQEHIRYSGSPIPLSFGEANDTKEIRCLDFASGKLVQNQSISVPQLRPLIQINTTRVKLEETFQALESELAVKSTAETSPKAQHPNVDRKLEPWVEVIVAGASNGEDLIRTVSEAAKGKPFQVICVRPEETTTMMSLGLSETAAEFEATHLLADATAVFKLRLEQEETLPDEVAAQLLTAFQQVHAAINEGKD